MFGLGVTEIIVILAIALIFLGPKKLPALARGLGKGLRNFQDALRGVEEEITSGPQEKIAKDDEEQSEKMTDKQEEKKEQEEKKNV